MAGSVVLGDSGVAPNVKSLPVAEVGDSYGKKNPTVSKSPEKTPSAPRKEEEAVALKKDEVTDVADALNAVAKALDRQLSFKVDDETGRIMIQVLDKETGEVIRSIPPEDIKNMRDSMGSLVGLIYNDMS